jgi:hypothetical protein
MKAFLAFSTRIRPAGTLVAEIPVVQEEQSLAKATFNVAAIRVIENIRSSFFILIPPLRFNYFSIPLGDTAL